MSEKTHYEVQFGRPLPERFTERPTCLGCGEFTDTERDCGCPAGGAWRAVRKDGKPLTKEDRAELFPKDAEEG